MEPDSTIPVTSDELVEFEEDGAAFAQGEREFVKGAAAGATSAQAHSGPPPVPADQEAKDSV